MLPPPDMLEIISRGQKARTLLNSEAFIDTLNDLSSYHLAAIAACPTDDVALATLRYHHLHHTALGEIAMDLTGRADAGANAERVLKEAQEADEEIDEDTL